MRSCQHAAAVAGFAAAVQRTSADAILRRTITPRGLAPNAHASGGSRDELLSKAVADDLQTLAQALGLPLRSSHAYLRAWLSNTSLHSAFEFRREC